ncbi:MAG TPA: APC family permease, partial [Candidatus Binataceae bacterium]|nr:APC family permease [Candidatus Binataceae bacterium]
MKAPSDLAAESRPVASGLPAAGRRLGLLSLVCVMYLVISGGPYGMEDAVGLAGPRLVLLLCLLVPLSLSLPTALMAAELTALMPLEGGFYFWVKAALGPFAGFAEAYLTILYTAVDTAIYPVLFATYAAFLLPIGTRGQLALGIAMVWVSGGLNAMGVRPVGRVSVLLAALLIAPFAALIVIGFPRLLHLQLPPQTFARGDLLPALGGALTIVIWNFGGWENLSVVAGEIDQPRRNYLRAIMIVVPAVALGYLLPLAVCLSGATSGAGWRSGSFADQGLRIGGPLLGAAIGIGGAVSSFAVFEAAMLWVSRMPFVLSRERYLPDFLGTISSRRAIPGRSILLCCIIFTLLVPFGFVMLVVLDVFFYMMALVLEMWALIRLRRLYPRREGLFVIGGGRAGLYAIAGAPLLTWIATFGVAVSQNASDLVIALALAACVWPCYALLRRRYGGPSGHV